jgi:hypothetical protein
VRSGMLVPLHTGELAGGDTCGILVERFYNRFLLLLGLRIPVNAAS